MSDPVAIDADNLGKLTDQLWRRLGITQTFDRLLVQAVALTPGSEASVRAAAGASLQGGAAKFWEISFPQIKRDLCRKSVLAEASGALDLHESFSERLRHLLEDVAEGASRVVPTPGVTVEAIQRKAQEREAFEKMRKAQERSSARKKAAPSAAAATESARPKKRSAAGGATAAAPSPVVTPTEPANPTVAPPNKLFTTLKVNKLLDHLDNTQLNKTQLGARLSLSGVNLVRFLEVTDKLDVTRLERDDFVMLHWKGRELAQTSSADRRMAVHDLVRELRRAADEVADEQD